MSSESQRLPGLDRQSHHSGKTFRVSYPTMCVHNKTRLFLEGQCFPCACQMNVLTPETALPRWSEAK